MDRLPLRFLYLNVNLHGDQKLRGNRNGVLVATNGDDAQFVREFVRTVLQDEFANVLVWGEGIRQVRDAVLRNKSHGERLL